MMKDYLRALHAADISCFLAKHGLLPEIEAGRIKCRVCGEILSVENFGAVTRHKDELTFACNKETCLLALMDAVAERSTDTLTRREPAAFAGVR
jgi:hypothetical protein